MQLSIWITSNRSDGKVIVDEKKDLPFLKQFKLTIFLKYN